MPEFLEIIPPKEALTRFMSAFRPQPSLSRTRTELALNQILAEDVLARVSLPSFRRSTVDGYAVIARNTHGASQSLPAYLRVLGEVPMGGEPGFKLDNHQAAIIHTGGMLPEGADAVVMVEETQTLSNDEVEIYKAVAAGENVLQVGEDVSKGDLVLKAGQRLRPAEIGGLMAQGITEVPVYQNPLVGIISSGDEVVDPHESLAFGQVYDINSYSLSALVTEAGGTSKRYGIAPDTFEGLHLLVQQAVTECDMVVITAGSSASTRDLTAAVIDSIGQPGVLVHGVNVRPGKPTILGVCENTPVIGLPGNPVSALVIARLFVRPAIQALKGVSYTQLQAQRPAELSINLSSQTGREDWVPVKLTQKAGSTLAEPVFGKSNLIFTLAAADGLICIPADANGLSKGSRVDVELF